MQLATGEVIVVGSADAGERSHPLTLVARPVVTLLLAHMTAVCKRHTGLFTCNHSPLLHGSSFHSTGTGFTQTAKTILALSAAVHLQNQKYFIGISLHQY